MIKPPWFRFAELFHRRPTNQSTASLAVHQYRLFIPTWEIGQWQSFFNRTAARAITHLNANRQARACQLIAGGKGKRVNG